jgi:hypothetical protein
MNTLESVLRLAFDNSAPHIVNLDVVRLLIQQAILKTASVDDAITYIESSFPEAEVTLKTDIRILIAAIRHATRQRKSSG